MVTIVKGKNRGKNGILKRVMIEEGIAKNKQQIEKDTDFVLKQVILIFEELKEEELGEGDGAHMHDLKNQFMQRRKDRLN